MTAPRAFDLLRVQIHDDRVAAGRGAAEAAAAAIADAIARRGEARVVFACAPSQSEMLAALRAARVDWPRVTAFHMDEYLGLGAGHPASFRQYLSENLLRHVRPGVFHGIDGEARDPAAECRRYAALLQAAPLDLVCLGIGENGHLAFNDPPVADFNDPQVVKVVELDDACRRQQVNDGCFPALESVPRRALTLTIPALLSARSIVGTVPGSRKAAAVRDALLGPVTTACPASVLRAHASAVIHLDRDAAAGLVTWRGESAPADPPAE